MSKEYMYRTERCSTYDTFIALGIGRTLLALGHLIADRSGNMCDSDSDSIIHSIAPSQSAVSRKLPRYMRAI